MDILKPMMWIGQTADILIGLGLYHVFTNTRYLWKQHELKAERGSFSKGNSVFALTIGRWMLVSKTQQMSTTLASRSVV